MTTKRHIAYDPKATYPVRAFDVESGEELWHARLPYGPQATPMSYRAGGRQYVVIASTGYGRIGMPVGDAIVAFALP